MHLGLRGRPFVPLPIPKLPLNYEFAVVIGGKSCNLQLLTTCLPQSDVKKGVDMQYTGLKFVDINLHSVVDTMGVQGHVACNRLHQLYAQIKGRRL